MDSQRQPRRQTILMRCMAVISDCPGGVSDRVLAADLGLTVKQMWRAMEPALEEGTVLRVRIPKAHGGGKGYQVPGATMQAAIPASADVRGAFDLVDDNTRLALAWDGARIVLPADVTRGLFRFLEARVQQRHAAGGAA